MGARPKCFLRRPARWLSLGIVKPHFARPVKRKITLLLAAALIVFGGAYAFQPDRSVDYASFQPRFLTAVRSGGLETVEIMSCSRDQVPLPLAILWHPRRWHSDSGIHAVTGFPDSAERYKLAADGSPPCDCFVRYLDGRATVIAIRARTAQESVARTLRSTLAHEFPGLAITLTTNDP